MVLHVRIVHAPDHCCAVVYSTYTDNNKQTSFLIGPPEEYVHGHALSIMLTQIAWSAWRPRVRVGWGYWRPHEVNR